MTDVPTDSYDAQLLQEIDEVAAEHQEYVSGLTSTPDADPEQEEQAALDLLTDTSAPEDQRIEVLRRRTGAALGRSDRGIAALLGVVGDRSDAAAVRSAALDVLRAAAFSVETFAPHHAAYVDVLRTLLTDEVPELRELATATLAQEHDPVLQDTLAAGLRREGPLPVDRVTAIRALAEDDHLDNVERLRELLRSDSPDERQEAIRYLGSYQEAAGDVEAVLRDQDEDRAVRQQSAASLRALDPERFQEVAKEIATDDAEYADVRTVTLGALTHLGDTDQVYADDRFLDQVRSISGDDSAPQVATAAQELLDQRPDS